MYSAQKGLLNNRLCNCMHRKRQNQALELLILIFPYILNAQEMIILNVFI